MQSNFKVITTHIQSSVSRISAVSRRGDHIKQCWHRKTDDESTKHQEKADKMTQGTQILPSRGKIEQGRLERWKS